LARDRLVSGNFKYELNFFRSSSNARSCFAKIDSSEMSSQNFSRNDLRKAMNGTLQRESFDEPSSKRQKLNAFNNFGFMRTDYRSIETTDALNSIRNLLSKNSINSRIRQ
jgi:hypothetical protein